MVDEVLHDMEIIINNKKAKITRDNLPEISGQAIQLSQLFQNLISNALKFNDSAETVVKISGEIIQNENIQSGTVCKIYIKDNGIGFSPEYQTKIFEVFQRLHGKAEYPGTGMGLAISKKIVENKVEFKDLMGSMLNLGSTSGYTDEEIDSGDFS